MQAGCRKAAGMGQIRGAKADFLECFKLFNCNELYGRVSFWNEEIEMNGKPPDRQISGVLSSS